MDVGVGVAKGAKVEPPADDEWGLLRLGALTSGEFTASQAKRLVTWDPAYPRLEVRARDVLMVRVNGAQALVGASCVAKHVRPRLVLSDLMYRLVPDPERLNAEFLGLMLASDRVRRQVRRGMRGTSGQFQIPQAEVKKLQVPLFPLPEQRDIVAANEAFERRIGALERELAKLATLRRGIVDERATGPDARLGDLLTESPKNGYSASEVHEWTGMLVLGLGCLTNDGFVPRQLKRIPKSPLAERSRLADGDLLMSRANTRELVGLAARFRDVGQPCSYPDLMMRLRPDEDRCLTAYLELVLGSSRVRRDVQAGARGTSESMVKISAGTVESLRIPLPTITEQRKAVDAVMSVDRRSATVRVLLDKLRVTQRAVVEDLLSGRTRVNRT
ncbi:hypothetical protein SAM23877_5232 [Streptomyces ambofaciens ATCC 23877]|uniref:Type I restriction modification DNA specificity domain-containing protein n=2 Tax=Streptomyces ambofaciens TaxID=1889 RepID=A0A0K2AZK9_STRA7|nr:hypothetical protein SAM23877_5232 [Streptomyces ambofaciens ATCC 23877]